MIIKTPERRKAQDRPTQQSREADAQEVRTALPDLWARLRRVWTIHGRSSAAFTESAINGFLLVGYQG